MPTIDEVVKKWNEMYSKKYPIAKVAASFDLAKNRTWNSGEQVAASPGKIRGQMRRAYNSNGTIYADSALIELPSYTYSDDVSRHRMRYIFDFFQGDRGYNIHGYEIVFKIEKEHFNNLKKSEDFYNFLEKKFIAPEKKISIGKEDIKLNLEIGGTTNKPNPYRFWLGISLRLENSVDEFCTAMFNLIELTKDDIKNYLLHGKKD